MISFSIRLEETTVDPSLAGRSRDWWSQAVRNLRFAEEIGNGDWHEWACFAAHQAAEMAVKALYLHLGRQPKGSTVSRLLKELPSSVGADPETVESGKVLDTFYIPSRSPDGRPHFYRVDAETLESVDLGIPSKGVAVSSAEFVIA